MQFKLFCAVPVIMHTRQAFLGGSVKLQKATIRFVMSVCLSVSVCPHGTTPIPLHGFSWNLVCEDFSKLYRENPTFIKIRQAYGYFTGKPMYVYDVSFNSS